MILKHDKHGNRLTNEEYENRLKQQQAAIDHRIKKRRKAAKHALARKQAHDRRVANSYYHAITSDPSLKSKTP